MKDAELEVKIQEFLIENMPYYESKESLNEILDRIVKDAKKVLEE